MKNNAVATQEMTGWTPKYYEVYGAKIANGNRAWVVAFLALAVAIMAIGFAVFTKIQPPTVIAIGPNHESSLLGGAGIGPATGAAVSGTDEFLNEAFVRRFLDEYLNYSASDVDDRWYRSLNMMTLNLRKQTLDEMKAKNKRGEVVQEQIESEFHLRDISAVPGERLTYLIYGVKDVHRLTNGTETTDHFVNEYRVRLKTDQRSQVNPDGLWIAKYSERPIDDGRIDHTSNEPDTNWTADKGGQ